MELVEIIREKAYIEGEFVLTSGKKSNYYINIKQAYTNPEILRLIAVEISKKLEKLNCELIAGVELGAVPILAAVSITAHKPFLIIRKEKKGYGAKSLIEGEFQPGQRVVVLEDVTTTGGSVLRAVRLLRQHKLICEHVITVVDREEGAFENLKKERVELIPLVRVSELRR